MSEETEYQDADPIDVISDPIAARGEVHRRMLVDLAEIGDDDLRKEGLAMLRALRLSFRTQPQGELAALPGGKA